MIEVPQSYTVSGKRRAQVHDDINREGRSGTPGKKKVDSLAGDGPGGKITAASPYLSAHLVDLWLLDSSGAQVAHGYFRNDPQQRYEVTDFEPKEGERYTPPPKPSGGPEHKRNPRKKHPPPPPKKKTPGWTEI